MKRRWFVRKTYGWGWTPSSWQGWVATMLGISALILNAYRFVGEHSGGATSLVFLIVENTALALLFILLCYLTGERPKWQWGKEV